MVHQRPNSAGTHATKAENSKAKFPHRLHESMSESAIHKSANDLRTIGDCCARRQSLGRLADTVEVSLRKAQYRRSDSLLRYWEEESPTHPIKICCHCEDHVSSSGSNIDCGLHFHAKECMRNHNNEKKAT